MKSMDNTVTRDDVEKALWLTSAWRIEEHEVEAIMAKVDAYAGRKPPVPEPKAATRPPAPRVVALAPAPITAPAVDEPDEMRVCRVCGVAKPLTVSFCRDTKGRDGRKMVCTTCDNIRKRESRRAKSSIAARTRREAGVKAA